MMSFLFRRKHTAARRTAIFGLLGVYLFALVFLPALHGHGTCCTVVEPDCCCGSEHNGTSDTVAPADDCDLCRIIHTSVPLVNVSPAILEQPFEAPRPTSPLFVFHISKALEVPSCRAPPSEFS